MFEVGHICEAEGGGNHLTWQMVQSEAAKRYGVTLEILKRKISDKN